MIRIIREQGAEWLGISTGLRGKSFSISRLTSMRSSPGWIVGGPEIMEWRFQGFSTQEGEVWLYGEKVDGRPRQRSWETAPRSRCPSWPASWTR